MQYVILSKAETDSVEIVKVNNSEDVFKEIRELIGAPVAELVKTERMKRMTQDKDTGEFICMLTNKSNGKVNKLGTSLYGAGNITGDVVLCKYKYDVFGYNVKTFDSVSEAEKFLSKIVD